MTKCGGLYDHISWGHWTQVKHTDKGIGLNKKISKGHRYREHFRSGQILCSHTVMFKYLQIQSQFP